MISRKMWATVAPGERTLVALDNALEYLRLALGPVVHHLFTRTSPRSARQHVGQLDIGHPLGTLGAAADQRLYVTVDGVDICPDLVEIPVVSHIPARMCRLARLTLALLEVLHEGDQRIYRTSSPTAL